MFWGKRKGTNLWQLPQGGVIESENLEQAMLRELNEEVGLSSKHIDILGQTKQWLYYDVPSHYIRKENNLRYKGQKQIWFLLKLLVNDSNINISFHKEQEFDDWKWVEYWYPLDKIVDFKKLVYKKALNELSNFIL